MNTEGIPWGSSEQAMLPEREYERPKPSNGVLRHPLEPDSSASCFQQLRGKDTSFSRDAQDRMLGDLKENPVGFT